MIDKRLKSWLLRTVYAAAVALLGYIFRDLLLTRVTVPLFVFPLLVFASATLALWLWHRITAANKVENIGFLRGALKPGTLFGVINGEQNLTVVEWSWFNPNIVIAQNGQGHTVRVHASIVVVYV
ncbi:MAG: hypothetical protein RBU23_12845 [Candidatus Auribacterota bacterium]|jgi:hypothetical protein|nr:hypothetical protein [Candidatus Auribacterota bacterium]